jgi:hypothetical protein
MSIQRDVDGAAKVAKASTQAAFRATLIGVIPIIELGALVALTILIVALPVKLVRMVSE